MLAQVLESHTHTDPQRKNQCFKVLLFRFSLGRSNCSLQKLPMLLKKKITVVLAWLVQSQLFLWLQGELTLKMYFDYFFNKCTLRFTFTFEFHRFIGRERSRAVPFPQRQSHYLPCWHQTGEVFLNSFAWLSADFCKWFYSPYAICPLFWQIIHMRAFRVSHQKKKLGVSQMLRGLKYLRVSNTGPFNRVCCSEELGAFSLKTSFLWKTWLKV